ncbi:MAG: trypsin-like peptidase domain-containing protein [Candidatus Sulfotelmatobacter sp.]
MPLLEDSLVLLYKHESQDCAGGGILIGTDLVLTCAHVVNLACGREISATGRPEGTISLRLLSSRLFACEATVATGEDAWSDPPPQRSEGADLCVLHLCQNAPSNVTPATLWHKDDLVNCKFRAVGFPDDYKGDIDVARGEIVGRDEYGLYLLQPEPGALPAIAAAAKSHLWTGEHRIVGEIHSDFSGTPVEVEGRIVGLIAESRRPSEATGYMIPVLSFPECVARDTWGQPGKPVVTIEQISDVIKQEDDFWSALEIYNHRLPAGERYDDEVFIDLIKHHLAGEFGPHRPSAYWKAHLLVAKYGQEVVGMLLAYNYKDSRSNFLYVPYLVAREPKENEPNPDDISRNLIRSLDRVQQALEGGGQRAVFLTEVDDPTAPCDPGEQRTRLARIKLFNRIAAFANIELRCLDFKFLQPQLVPWGKAGEMQLRLLYGVEHPPSMLSKAQLLDIVTWFYKQLYAANISDDPGEGEKYERYLDELLKRATAALPDGVKILRWQEILQDSEPLRKP